MDRIVATYRLRSAPADIAARAQGLALEQSIEAPPEAVRDDYVAREIVAQVRDIREAGAGSLRGHAGPFGAATVGGDAGQLAQHAVRQFLASDGRRTARFRPARRDALAVRRAGAGSRGPAGAHGRAVARAHLRRPQAAGARAGGAGRADGGARARRRRFHQGRPRARRPDLFALRRAGSRLCGGGPAGGAAHGAARPLCARRSAATTGRCATRSRSPATPGSISAMVAPIDRGPGDPAGADGGEPRLRVSSPIPRWAAPRASPSPRS